MITEKIGDLEANSKERLINLLVAEGFVVQESNLKVSDELADRLRKSTQSYIPKTSQVVATVHEGGFFGVNRSIAPDVYNMLREAYAKAINP